MKFWPESTAPLRKLAEVLLRDESALTSAERETIAAFVSSGNDCRFCQLSHSAAAAEHLGGNEAHYALVESVKTDFSSAKVSPKLKSLLAIADKVRKGGKNVTPQDIAAARAQNATRQRNPRHGSHHRSFLHVQPLRRWTRNVAAGRPSRLSSDGKTHGTFRLYSDGVGEIASDDADIYSLLKSSHTSGAALQAAKKLMFCIRARL